MLLGCERLNIGSDGCKVVLEEDGSEIEDDELLQELEASTLMILQQGEDWMSESEQKMQAQASVPETKENGKHFTGDHSLTGQFCKGGMSHLHDKYFQIDRKICSYNLIKRRAIN